MAALGSVRDRGHGLFKLCLGTIILVMYPREMHILLVRLTQETSSCGALRIPFPRSTMYLGKNYQ
jgi:hypothetical protein